MGLRPTVAEHKERAARCALLILPNTGKTRQQPQVPPGGDWRFSDRRRRRETPLHYDCRSGLRRPAYRRRLATVRGSLQQQAWPASNLQVLTIGWAPAISCRISAMVGWCNSRSGLDGQDHQESTSRQTEAGGGHAYQVPSLLMPQPEQEITVQESRWVATLMTARAAGRGYRMAKASLGCRAKAC